jgi:glucan phosphorylase
MIGAGGRMQQRDHPQDLGHPPAHRAPALRPGPGEAARTSVSTEAASAMAAIDRFIPRTRIAYLSMEIAWEPTVPTYAGGLGVLAGDTARSCAQLDLPVVFVTPISREGYLSQSILPDGRQADHPEPWQPDNWAIALDARSRSGLRGAPSGCGLGCACWRSRAAPCRSSCSTRGSR